MMGASLECKPDNCGHDTADAKSTWRSQAHSLVIRTVAALTVMFLWFGPYMSMYFTERNRCLRNWDIDIALYLLGTPTLIALAFVGISELLRRLGRPSWTRIFNHLFVMALGGGLMTVLLFAVNKLQWLTINPSGTQVYTTWMLLSALVGYSFARPGSKLIQRSRRLCMILSPFVPIMIVQLLAQRTYPLRMDSLEIVPSQSHNQVAQGMTTEPHASGDLANARPVYFFIFDEWSYDRTFHDGDVNPTLTNIAQVANQAFVFANAHSPYSWTKRSVPDILFQTNLPTIEDYPDMGFERDGQFVSCSEFDSIFSCTADRGYRSVMIGFGCPINLWLNDQVDCCRVYPYSAKGRNLFEWMAVYFTSAASQMNGPWFTAFHKTFYQRVRYPHFRRLLIELENDITQVLTKWPRNTFAVMHYNLPHRPYLLQADGNFREPDLAIEDDTLENYQANLVRLDQTIGRFIHHMKEAHTYDDALIIMTSDHGWRWDPALGEYDPSLQKTHVPLFVKMPGQRRSVKIADEYELIRLRPLIEYALSGNGDDLEGALRVVQENISADRYLAQGGE